MIPDYSNQLGKSRRGFLRSQASTFCTALIGVASAHLLNVHKLSLIDLCNRDVMLGCDCKPSLGEKAESSTCFTYTKHQSV